MGTHRVAARPVQPVPWAPKCPKIALAGTPPSPLVDQGVGYAALVSSGNADDTQAVALGAVVL